MFADTTIFALTRAVLMFYRHFSPIFTEVA